MDDFIYNVRTGNIKNMNKPNRRFDNNRFKGQDRSNKSNNRHAGKDHRKGYVNYRSLSTDQFTTLKEFLGGLAENQKRLVTIAQSVEKSQERQAVAMEKIAAHLGALVKTPPGATFDPAPPQTDAVVETTEPAKSAEIRDDVKPETRPRTRSELVALITRMRDQRLSYDKIALEFETMQIPTLSGRGKWRGQTIYRLFKEG